MQLEMFVGLMRRRALQEGALAAMHQASRLAQEHHQKGEDLLIGCVAADAADSAGAAVAVEAAQVCLSCLPRG